MVSRIESQSPIKPSIKNPVVEKVSAPQGLHFDRDVVESKSKKYPSSHSKSHIKFLTGLGIGADVY